MLEEARRVIGARRQMHARAVEIRQTMPPQGEAVDFKCNLRHRGGKTGPKCAEVYKVTSSLLLFISRIAWRPQDQVQAPPWEVEHFLGAGISDDGFRLLMDDDAVLDRVLSQHSTQPESADVPGDGRWARKRGPREIVALVTPDADPPVGLWVRCPAHPGSPELLTRQQLFDATRLL